MGYALIIAAAFQAAAPAVAAPQAPEGGVIAYPPSFFAESQPVNAYDMVLRLPGFTFDKGQAVRGLAGSGGNVLIDGQPPVAKNDALDEILKRIPASTVERVEVIRGGAPGIDMEGRTVLANVVRKQTGGGFKGAVTVTNFYVYDGRDLPGIRAEGQWRFSGGRSAELAQIVGMGARDDLGDGGRIRYNADGTIRLVSRVDADSQGAKIWTTGAFETPLMTGRLRLNGAFMLSPADLEIYDNYTSIAGLEYERDKIDGLQAEIGGRYSQRLNDMVTMETVALQQFNNNDTTVLFTAPGVRREFELEKKSSETVGRQTFRIAATPSLSIETGAEGALNRLRSETALALNGVGIAVPAANVKVKEQRGELFARAAWRATPELTLEAGARYEASHVTSRGDVVLGKTLTYLKPRGALTWAPTPLTQVRLRVEREVGQLNFEDFVASTATASTGTVVAGNPDLIPQQSWVYEGALEQRFWGSGALVLTYRHFDIDDVVDRVPILSPAGVILADAPGNIGTGTKDEYQVSLTIPMARLGVKDAQLKGQVTKRDTKVRDPLDGRTREISVLHPIDWEVHWSQDLPQWKATYGLDLFNASRERFFRLTEIETRKQTASLWLNAEYKPRPDWVIRFEGQALNFRNVKRIREVYTGPRSNGRLDYTDVRDLEWGGSYIVRVRKIFG